MTDDLTPEEKEALQRLPRERMPSAALEDRVVADMRGRGVLKPRRRTIDITGGRVATLVAASVALVIGAYAIGLNRGGAESRLTPSGLTAAEAPVQEETSRREAAPAAPATDEAREDQPRAGENLGEATREVQEQESIAEMKKSIPAEEPTLVRQKAERPAKSKMNSGDAGAEFAAPAPAASMEADRVESAAMAKTLAPAPGRIFVLNGFPVIVEAPDSVRVTQEAPGATLLIHTSDGVIRVRPADNR